jgi:hypothetical protein
MRTTHAILTVAASLLLAACASAGRQATSAATEPLARPLGRPIPYPVTYSQGYEAALERGTRTKSGAPGHEYWQQWADYVLTVRLFPEEKRLEGKATIVYQNNSPDTLPVLQVSLYQNLHREGAPRVFPTEVTGGTQLARVAADGENLQEGGREGPRYGVSGTTLSVYPPQPVVPGGEVTIQIDWSFDIPRGGAGGRMGWRDDESFFLAYWYPQMAVYDDVVGWQDDWFLGMAEFYAGFADYDLTIEVPEGYVVMATGVLQNPDEVLAPHIAERLRRAGSSDARVSVVTAEDIGACTRSGENGYLRWHFVADRVRDVTIAASSVSLWDAARTPVGDRDGDGTTDYTRVDALYSEDAPRWAKMVSYEQHAITFESEYTGIPYPWPHMTAVESEGSASGMEYPMMTLIGHYNESNDTAFYHVTAHELAHMWQPMIVNSDESRHAWMDEGAASFIENQAVADFFPGRDNEAVDRNSYLTVARFGFAGEMMRPSNLLDLRKYGVTSYSKPATVLAVLRELLGEETFLRAYRTFLGEWAFKHPYPWDMFATFERVSGRDLDWFWRSWYYETWTLDQAVASVEESGDGTRIVVEDLGWVPMPVRLTITRAGGEVLDEEIPVETWLAGATKAAAIVPAGAPVTKVEIDSSHAFPDIDRDNNVWIR